MIRICALGFFTIALSACGSAPPKSSPEVGPTFERFSAPLGENLAVNIGDHLFVEGEVVRVPVLEMSTDINSTMPGAYGVPFSFSIQRSALELRYERGQDEFYCAPDDHRTASFPGLGFVVAPGDCVGIMKDKKTGELRWVVDNSIHNSSTTVWSRAVKPSDGVELTEAVRTRTDSRANMEVAYFQGFYSGLLHFKYHQFTNGQEQVQEFKFDYPPREGDAKYGIRGKTFEVIDVDNTKMLYKWVSIPAS